MAESVVLPGAAGDLVGRLALPPGAERGAAAMVLCHGFPSPPRGARASGEGYAELAEFVADETGAAVLTFTFRGCGRSAGDFSLRGWIDDLGVAVDWLIKTRNVGEVGVAGFSAGGAVALCRAAVDERVSSVAGFAVPATFDDWSNEPRKFLDRCRSLGVVRDKDFPLDVAAWAQEFVAETPERAAAHVGKRPVMLVQGYDDDVVAPTDVRRIEAAITQHHGDVEVRMLVGAGHRLRHDPRAIAMLVGWASRLGPVRADSE
ncbi:MAG TPA: alpha/beta fold hydrolase [Acidimicrobiales bacterium]|nr:alpha/beta fold hydrolase [Acidimicrobiales bacterium]